MPERVTREERMVSLAIEKARKAKEELSAKQRKNNEPTQVLEIDTDPEVEKIKKPKVQDASKITNQTQKNEGYGLAGESLKKQDKPKEPFKTRIIKKDFKDMRNLLSKLEFTTNRLVEDLYANLRENPTKMNRRNFDAIQQISRLINDDNDGAVAIARGIEFII